MSGSALRLALADDQALVRAGLRALLERLDLVVALEAEDGHALLEAVAAQPVDVILSDVRMPGLDGIAMVHALRGRGDPTPVLLLTTFDEADLLLHAREAGAQGFLLKDAAPEQLHEAIRHVAAGGTLLAPVSTEPVRARFRFRDDTPRRWRWRPSSMPPRSTRATTRSPTSWCRARRPRRATCCCARPCATAAAPGSRGW